MKFTPPIDTRENNLRPLCSLALSVICCVFVCAAFLQNMENWDIFC